MPLLGLFQHAMSTLLLRGSGQQKGAKVSIVYEPGEWKGIGGRCSVGHTPQDDLDEVLSMQQGSGLALCIGIQKPEP